MYKLKTLKTFVIYFHLLFSREILSWMFTEQRSTFYSNGKDGLFFVFLLLLLLLLLCAVLLVTVLVLFQNKQ